MSRKLTLPALHEQGYLRRQGRGEILGLVGLAEEGLLVISSGQGSVWSLPSGDLNYEIHGPASTGHARGARVALGSRSIHLWEEGRLLQQLDGHVGRLSALELSPDGSFLASLGEDGLKIWALGEDAPLRELPAQGEWLALDWAAGRAAVASRSTSAIEWWDIRSGVGLPPQMGSSEGHLALAFDKDLVALGLDGRLEGSDDDVSAMMFHPQGRALGTHEGVILWQEGRWEAHDEPVRHLAMSPSGAWLASAGERCLKVWSAAGELLVEIGDYKEWVCSQAVSPDGQLLALGNVSGGMRVVDLLTGRQRYKLNEVHADAVTSLAFSPDGNWLAWGSEDCLVGLWQTRRKNHLILDEHDAGVACLAFSSDGKLLASGSADDEVVLWDTESGMALETLHGLEAGLEQLNFSRQGVLVALYDDGTSVLWEISRYQS